MNNRSAQDDAAEFKGAADRAIEEFLGAARMPPVTLRDYFAAEALHAAWQLAIEAKQVPPMTRQEIAATAYAMADAMLVARE